MRQRLVDLYKKVRALHDELHAGLLHARKECASTRDMNTAADDAYALREMRELLKDSMSNANQFYDQVVKQTCLLWSVQLKQDPTSQPPPIKTEHCHCTPDVKEGVNLPKKDSQEYKELCAHFGITPGMEDVVGFHWPSLMGYVDQLAMEGKPLPPCLQRMTKYNIYKMTIRKTKGVDE